MKKLIILLSILLSFLNIIYCQNMIIEWQNCFGGSKDDHATDIIKLEDGFLIAGSTTSNDGDISYLHGGQDWWLVKTDVTSNMIWEKSYGGSNGEHLLRILPSSDSNYYLLGSSYSSNGDISIDPYPESTDYWIVKIDSSGNILWDRIIGGNMLDQMWTGTSTFDGGVLAYGWTGSEDGDVSVYYGAYDAWMVKFNSEGEKEWDFSIGTSGMDVGQAIIQTSDGGYLVGGSSRINDGGNLTCEPHSFKAEAILVKLDSNRNIEWQQCYGGSDNDGVTALTEVSDGYIFAGYVNSNDGDISGWHGENDIWVVKIDFYGNIIWQKCLGGSRSEFVSKLIITDEEEIIIPGITQSNDGDVVGNHTLSEHDFDIWIVKLSSDGELLSQQCIGGGGDENLEFGVVKKSDNNYVIAGQTNYGPSFDVECTPHAGTSTNYPDFWVFEIEDTTTNIINNITKEKVINVYPNPAQDYVNFEYNLPADKKEVILSVINILGIETARFKITDKKGIKVWDTKNVKPSIYFYNLSVSGFNKSGKIIITK